MSKQLEEALKAYGLKEPYDKAIADFETYYFEPIRAKWPKLRADHPGSKFIEAFIKDAEETMEHFKEAGFPVSNSMTRNVDTAAIESRMVHLRCLMRHM